MSIIFHFSACMTVCWGFGAQFVLSTLVPRAYIDRNPTISISCVTISIQKSFCLLMVLLLGYFHFEIGCVMWYAALQIIGNIWHNSFSCKSVGNRLNEIQSNLPIGLQIFNKNGSGSQSSIFFCVRMQWRLWNRSTWYKMWRVINKIKNACN